MSDILFAIWFFLPAGVANVVPILVAPLPIIRGWNYPMDFHKTFKGKRILGDHKTWRGFIAGVIAAVFVFWLQQYLAGNIAIFESFVAAHNVDYVALPTLIVGALFGIGALGGDAVESFFKRQRGTKPGDGWFPWDQTDYIIGGAIATAAFIRLSVLQYIWLILLWLIIHIVASYIGWLLKLKDKPL